MTKPKTDRKKPNRRTPREAFEDGIQEIELAIRRYRAEGQYKLAGKLRQVIGELAPMPDDPALQTPPAEQGELNLEQGDAT